VTPDELRAWRRALRERLIAERLALARATRERHRRAIDAHLAHGFPELERGVVAFCWPYQGEYDARLLARRLRARGAVTALPAVVAPRAPLVFREWRPGVALARGVYGILYPASSREVAPDAVLVPVVAFDDAGFRLGYGGGYFDRTLAAAKRPVAIGVGYELAHVATVHPQPHDLPMDWIVTERGIYRRDRDRLEFLGAPPEGGVSALGSPACYGGEVDAGRLGG
jgi:5,10-methenyltetrahydrofolate synthetase